MFYQRGGVVSVSTFPQGHFGFYQNGTLTAFQNLELKVSTTLSFIPMCIKVTLLNLSVNVLSPCACACDRNGGLDAESWHDALAAAQ